MTVLRTPRSRCELGFARADITPPVGIYHRMWGAATHDQAAGVHRPLTASVLVARPAVTANSLPQVPGPEKIASEKSEQAQVLVALDHCLFWHPEMELFLDSVASGSGFPREEIWVLFSHTHAAGLMDRGRADRPGGDLIAGYLQELAVTVSRLIREAAAQVQPVSLTYGYGRCDLAAQRDFWDEERGIFVCGFNPGADSDDTLLLIRADDAAGRPLLSLVNYACHPTTLAWENQLISPDFPGALRETVERETGVPCVFVQGTSGDLGPREGFVGDPAVADRNGKQLGFAVLSAWHGLPPAGADFVYTGPVISGATLGTWKYAPESEDHAATAAVWRKQLGSVPLAYRPELPSVAQVRAARARFVEAETSARAAGNALAARDARAQIERQDRQLTRLTVLPEGERYPYPLRVWRLGDAVWVAVEGEPYQLLQRGLRARFPNVPVVVSALTNGSRISYLPPAEIYGKGIYQESIALAAPGSLEQVLAAAIAAVEELLRA